MFGVGETDIGQVIVLPIFLKRFQVIWSNNQDLGVLGGEFVVIQAQLRQVPAAERSHEAAV